MTVLNIRIAVVKLSRILIIVANSVIAGGSSFSVCFCLFLVIGSSSPIVLVFSVAFAHRNASFLALSSLTPFIEILVAVCHRVVD
jgi:hypothetical protein